MPDHASIRDRHHGPHGLHRSGQQLKLFTACPTYYAPTPEVIARLGWLKPTFASGMATHVARSELIGVALESGADALLFVDDDVAFGPEVVEALQRADRDIVLAPYKNKRNTDWCLRTPLGDPQIRPSPAGRLLTLECCALGCTLIRRRVLEAMANRYREDLGYLNDAGQRRVLVCAPGVVLRDGVPRADTEDFAWSDRARACGFGIDALVDVTVTHGTIVSSLVEIFGE